MNLDFKESANTIISILRVQKHIAIFIKGSPDPDAIASSYFLYCLCNALHVQATMFAFMPASLPSNREIISLFSIPLHIEDTIKAINMRRYSGYIVCDFQTAALEGIVNAIPCLIHLDHHAPVEDDVPAHFRILTDEVSSTSTLCALIMQYISCFSQDMIHLLATVLYLGIKTDSDNFNHLNKYDVMAIEYLKQLYIPSMIEKIESVPLSLYSQRLLQHAMANVVIYKDWLIAGVGFVEEEHRDTIAIIADYLLENNHVELAVVYGAVYHNNHTKLDIDASLRTKKEDLDLNELIKNITTDGGGRKYKGAFQVHIDFFVYCPDQGKLWDIIALTTHHSLKNIRDGMYKITIQSKFKKLTKTIKKLFIKANKEK